MRLLDRVLGGLLLAALAGPLGLAWGMGGRLRARVVQGQGGRPFHRLSLDLPEGRIARCLAAVGAAHWPVLINILRGEMAFVGPRPRDLQEPVPAEVLAARPGIVNPWAIRLRTAAAFGTEARADAIYLANCGVRHDIGLLLRGVAVALLPAPAAAVPGRVRIGDVAFDNVDMREAIERLGAMLAAPGAHQVSFVNPACVNIAARHRGYRRALARASLALPDGIGIKIGSDMLGTPLKQNVNGTDLFPRLCDLLQARGASVFLLGGHPGVAEGVAAVMAQRWPGVRIAGVRDGFFSVADEGRVAAQVQASGADILLVARGVPAQDLFIDRHLPLLGVKVAMGVGGLFDFVSGRIPRAPLWMRETGLEWVYRLAQEPGRMWRRYLVGNLTFLFRVGLQRMGLRPPQTDLGSMAQIDRLADARPARNVVLFATRRAGQDLPVSSDYPAALLPVQHQTLIEHVLDRLARVAATDVHVVMSDRPEALRRTLGDGGRWGLRLHWHLVKYPSQPYGPLRAPAMQGAGRLLVGHADVCLEGRVLRQLLAGPAATMHTVIDGKQVWTGWAGVDPAHLSGLPAGLDRPGLLASLANAGVAALACASQAATSADDARGLLRASFEHVVQGAGLPAPGTWIRQPWGAMSPLARVHPGATIVAPVWIGPGCIVERGAVVGPSAVLSRDVIVSAGTCLDHTVLLPGSYVGANLDLSHAVVNGARVRHLKFDIESRLAAGDATLMDLATDRSRQPSWPGRMLALCVLPLALPVLAVHAAIRWGTRRSPDWGPVLAVTGRDTASHELQVAELLGPRAGAGSPVHSPWSLLAGVLDVARGRRCWYGARPRSRSEWHALSPDWQAILAELPLGLLNAPTWVDHPSHREEASAAADVYWAVLPPWRRLLATPRVLGTLRWRTGAMPVFVAPASH